MRAAKKYELGRTDLNFRRERAAQEALISLAHEPIERRVTLTMNLRTHSAAKATVMWMFLFILGVSRHDNEHASTGGPNTKLLPHYGLY